MAESSWGGRVRILRTARLGLLGGAAVLSGTIAPGPAEARCSANPTSSNSAVFCDTNAPNPETAGIVGGAGINGVEVIVEQGALIVAPTAIDALGSGWLVQNQGTIGGTIQFAGSAQIVNLREIGADNGPAIALSNGGSIDNQGAIDSGPGPGILVTGGFVRIDNRRGGGIESQSSTPAISLQGSATGSIFNDGDIFGNIEAVNALSIQNFGSISASTIRISGKAVLTNEAFAEIGFNVAQDINVEFGNEADEFTNAGRIGGNVMLGGGNDVATLVAGQTLTGILDGGAGQDQLVLSGDMNSQLNVSSVRDFERGEKTGSGAWTLTGSAVNSFGVDFTVREGSLLVNSDTPGLAVSVGSGGLVGGTGRIGALGSIGIVAPGLSIGTLTVNDDATFNTGSRFQIEVQGDTEDRLNARNVFINGGIAEVDALPGRRAEVSTHTVISARDRVEGRFSSVENNLAYLIPSLRYTSREVELELSLNRSALPAGASQLPIGDPLLQALITLDRQQGAIAEDALTPDLHTSLRTQFLEDSRFVRDAVSARLFMATPWSGEAELAQEDGMAASAMALAPRDAQHTHNTAQPSGPAVWAQGFGSWAERDPSGGIAGLDRDIGGVLAGLDGLVAPGVRAGFFAGYSRSGFDHDRPGSADADSAHVGAYGGTRFGFVDVGGGAAYAWHDIDATRTVLFPGLSETHTAEYDSRTGQIFGEAAIQGRVGRIAVSPFAALAYVHLDTDSFRERIGAAALISEDGDDEVTFSTLGLRAGTSFRSVLGVTSTLRGIVGWRSAFGTYSPRSAFAFAGSSGNSFSVTGLPVSDDALVLEAHLDVELSQNATFGVGYTAQLAEEAEDHGLRGVLSWRF